MEDLPDRYQYRHISAERCGFRLASLLPATEWDSLICCELVEVTMEDHPNYEAISYVWGDPSKTATLQVEGAGLEVTENLEIALRHLRLRNSPRTLWVDAICIDQSNNSERSSQVRLMKDIYTNCIQDLVWLGEATYDHERGIEVLKSMKSLEVTRRTDTKKFSVVSLMEVGIGSGYELFIKSIIRDPLLWQRVWVMQEISCSPSALLVMGSHTLSWDVLSGILDHTGTPDRYHLPFSHQHYEKNVWDAFSLTQVISHQRDIIFRPQTTSLPTTLPDVLARFRNTFSTDPRDKIYGLLGLATDALDIIPDYNKSTREVYIDVARSHINSSKNLDIITQSLWPQGNRSIKALYGSRRRGLTKAYEGIDIPSWLPHFAATQTTKILFAQRDIFVAGRPTCDTPPRIDPNGRLIVTGCVLGSIETLKPVRRMANSGGTHTSSWMRDWLPSAISTTSSSPSPSPEMYTSTNEPLFAAFWRTLLTDCMAFPSRRLSSLPAEAIESLTEQFNTWHATVTQLPYLERDKYDGDGNAGLLASISSFAKQSGMSDTIRHWRFAELEHGLFAMVPWDGPGGNERPNEAACEADVVAVVDGGKVPIVLRPKPVQQPQAEFESNQVPSYEFIGTAYVHGFMDGEAETNKLERRIFHID